MSMQSRLTIPTRDAMRDDQRAVLDAILAGPRGNLDGPFLAWIHSPGLANPAQQLGAFCRYHTQLSLVESELAILTTAAWWRSQAEWMIHEPIARKAGLDGAIIDALQAEETPKIIAPRQQLIYKTGRALYKTRRVNGALYAAGVEAFGEQGMVELVGIYGYYAFVAMTLNTFEMRPEKAESLPFPE